jgi:hypothetical protein
MELVRHTAEIALQQCPVCGVEVPPRKTYCSNACRQQNYRNSAVNPSTSAGKLKKQRHDSRMELKIVRHIRGKATVFRSFDGVRRSTSGRRVKPPDPFGEPMARNAEEQLKRYPAPIPCGTSNVEESLFKGSRIIIPAPKPVKLKAVKMGVVGLTVVDPKTIRELKEVNPEIPDHIRPLQIDVLLRRGSPWESVKAMRDFESDCREDRREYREFRRLLIDGTVSIAFPDDEPLFWREAPLRFVPFSSCSATFPEDEPLFAEVVRRLAAESPVDTTGHRATALPTSRRGNRKRVRISRRKNWCADCKGYLPVKHDCVAVAT